MSSPDYTFPLPDNNEAFAKFVTQADKDRMKPELRHQLYQQISAKNALINKYLKKIAEKAEIATNLTMHISRHAFAHIAQEAGAESSAIKKISSVIATSLQLNDIWAALIPPKQTTPCERYSKRNRHPNLKSKACRMAYQKKNKPSNY